MADELAPPMPGSDPESSAPEPKKQERNWEEEAKKLGWKKDHDGPERVDAKEFVLRKPLFDQIHNLKKHSKELEAAVKHQRMVQDKLIEQERIRVMEQLQAERDKAIEDGDKKRVRDLDKEMVEKDKAFAAAKPAPMPKEFIDFVSDNDWYESNKKLKRYADALGNELYAENPKRPLSEIYAQVAREVKEEFPQYFSNPNREKPSAVSATTTKASAGKEELGWDDIPREYRRVAEAQWKSGAFIDKHGKPLGKREAMRVYAEELKKVGVI